MRVRVGELRTTLKEALETIKPGSDARRMTFEDLLDLHDDLEQRFVSGLIGDREFNDEWQELLAVAGWTNDQYEEELDRRWDYLDLLRATPAKLKTYN